ncbi:unnamed protein product [Caenorhabditis bovis]|uniref:Nuclear receptor domain-containing protein n=1 Tax=Caenorhabditis bovis TaxID=2654633 RepID=A0A8S1F5Y8_9PELO|nr:unnamed protein product [Caenorhabditis bovis]
MAAARFKFDIKTDVDVASTSSVESNHLPTDLAPMRKHRDEASTAASGNCVVCNAADSAPHFGVIACAACSAFFRRTVVLKRVYKCRRDPTGFTRCTIDRRHRCNCKCCRFKICIERGMNPNAVQYNRDTIRPRTPIEDSDFDESADSFKHKPTPSPKKPSDNLIENLCDLYHQIVDRRRMLYCHGSLREILHGIGLRFRPNRFDERYYKDKMRCEFVFYMEMMNSMELWRNLDAETKECLLRECTVSLALLEKYFITVKYGGLEDCRLIAPDGSYTDLSDNGAQFERDFDNPDHQIDKKTCLRLLYDPLREVLRHFGGALKASKMTDVEFCALFAILIFNPAATNLHQTGYEMVRSARNTVIGQWSDYYRSIGIGPMESSLLIGNSILLLSELRNAMTVHRENFHVIRVFKVMDYDSLIDDLRFH